MLPVCDAWAICCYYSCCDMCWVTFSTFHLNFCIILCVFSCYAHDVFLQPSELRHDRTCSKPHVKGSEWKSKGTLCLDVTLRLWQNADIWRTGHENRLFPLVTKLLAWLSDAVRYCFNAVPLPVKQLHNMMLLPLWFGTGMVFLGCKPHPFSTKLHNGCYGTGVKLCS